MDAYWNYLSYQDYSVSGNIVDESPRFYVYSVLWGVIFSAMYPISNVVCREIFPKFYSKVPEGLSV